MTQAGDKTTGLTYSQAGVDIDAGARMVDLIKPLVRATRRRGADAEIGGFGGLFDLKAAGFSDPILVAANDGVGTKVKIAIESGIHGTVGIDLVAMCVNDLVVQGAEPLFFLDYFATGKLDPETGAEIVKGIAAGCLEAGAALIGGETAEMPGVYAGADYDLAGFAVGAAERGDLLPRKEHRRRRRHFRPALLGRPFQRLFAGAQDRRPLRAELERSRPVRARQELAEALLEPTRIYVKPLLNALRKTQAIKAFAHITGGGYPENIPRVLPDGLGAQIDLDAIPVLPVFRWLAATGGVAEREMLRTFNCGDRHDRRRRLFARGGNRGGVARLRRGARASRPCRRGFGRARDLRRKARAVKPARKRVAILISGRGSNMRSLVEAARDPDYPAEIALVLSNVAAAPGLDFARTQGVATATVDHKLFANRESFERAMQETLLGAGHRPRLPRRLHAPADALVRRAMARQDAEHPPGPAALLSRPAYP